ESEIPCIDGIPTLLFKVREKAFDDIDSEVLDRHLGGFNRVALAQKVKEQAQGITIASLGVDTQVAIDSHLFQQETTHQRADQVRVSHAHAPFPPRHSAQSAMRPRPEAPGSC